MLYNEQACCKTEILQQALMFYFAIAIAYSSEVARYRMVAAMAREAVPAGSSI